MKKPHVLGPIFAVTAGFGLATTASGQLLDTLREYGNAAQGLPFSGMIAPEDGPEFQINPRGFTNTPGEPAGPYTITAGGTDFWSATDHGSYIFNADGAYIQEGDFSAVVRSVAAAHSTNADGAFEGLAGEWGRTGVMARVNPDAANSAYAAHIRKVGTTNAESVLQWRDSPGAGTTRVDPVFGNQEFNNEFDMTINGGVDNTPVWLALHRIGGLWAATWAPDDNGAPGVWSEANWHTVSPATAGAVNVGLAHQSHNISPQVNTSELDNFGVGPFDQTLGDFETSAPFVDSGTITQDPGTGNLSVTAFSQQVITDALANVDWEVQLQGAEGVGPGVTTEIYIGSGNPGNIGAAEAYFAANDPTGVAYADNVHWANPGRGQNGMTGYPPSFGAATGAFTAGGNGQEQYSTRSTFELWIPAIGDRAAHIEDFKEILFKDGVDDFAYLEVDGQELINDNTWTSNNGADNNGSPIAVLDVSDPKYDDGEWVPATFITGEGGGGDSGILYWDVYDGINNPDGFANPLDFPITNGEGAFVEDLIPNENFRTARPAITTLASGNGQPADQVVGTIAADTTDVFLLVNGSLVATIPVDRDGDGIPDTYETANGLNPNDPADALLDPDGDNLNNLEEFQNETDIADADSDDDGLNDGAEVKTHGSNPLSADGDGDLLLDGGEIAAGSDPSDPDSDDDGVYDGLEVERGTDPLTPNTGFGFGLVSHWPFEGDLNDAIDDNHGTGVGLDPIAFGDGKFGQGIELDGIDQWVEITGGEENEFDFVQGNMSISAWFRAESFTKGWQCLAAKGEGRGWRFHRRGSDVGVEGSGILTAAGGSGEGPIHPDGIDEIISTLDILDGSPTPIYNAVLTVEHGGDHILYVNGAEVTRNGSADLENRANRMRIGNNPDTGNRSWHGMIDDVAVWGRHLSSDEVAAIWNNGEGASIEALLAGGPAEPEAFRIASVSHDAALGDLTVTFPSSEGAEYAIEVSVDLTNWVEATDTTGAAGSETTTTVSAGDISGALGGAPSGQVYVRVIAR